MSASVTVTNEKFTLEVYKSVNKSLSTDFDKEKAANTLSNNLDNEQVKKKAYDDVKELSKAIQRIRTMFSMINVTLVDFDGKKFKDKHGKELQLGPQWRERMRTFEEVMQASYENATSAVNVMKEITSILGMNINEATNITFAEFKDEVESFIQKVDAKKTTALDTKSSFQSLADDIRLFSGQIDIVMQQAGGFEGVLATARQRIYDLTERLDIIGKEIRSLTVSLVSAVAIGATAGIFAFCTISPLAVRIAMGSLTASVAFANEWAAKDEEKEGLLVEKSAAEEHLDDILARQPELKPYVTKFEATKTQITQVAKQIDTITNIWQTINRDMLSIMESLQKNVSGNARITRFFWVKMAPTRETYRRLTECLEMYVEQSRSVYSDNDV